MGSPQFFRPRELRTVSECKGYGLLTKGLLRSSMKGYASGTRVTRTVQATEQVGMLIRFASRLAVAGAFVCSVAGCAAQVSSPTTWTLWYVPNGPRQGVTLAKICHTFVFSNPPEAKTFRVVTVKGLSGSGKIQESNAYINTGDVFDGPLELGQGTIHDDNAGYDLRVDVVYKIDSYVMAKTRADADCPPSAHVASGMRNANVRTTPQPEATKG